MLSWQETDWTALPGAFQGGKRIHGRLPSSCACCPAAGTDDEAPSVERLSDMEGPTCGCGTAEDCRNASRPSASCGVGAQSTCASDETVSHCVALPAAQNHGSYIAHMPLRSKIPGKIFLLYRSITNPQGMSSRASTKCAPETVKKAVLWTTPRPRPLALWCKGQPSCMRADTPCPAYARTYVRNVRHGLLCSSQKDHNLEGIPAWGFSVAATSPPLPFSNARSTFTASVHLHQYNT